MQEKSVFVIMPFSDTISKSSTEWTDIYNEMFAKAFKELGYDCNRIKPTRGNLIKSILLELKTAPIVLADLTDKNPNVFYELGVRHCLSKRTVIVSQRFSDVPSDLRGYWCLEYKDTAAGYTKFKNEIKRIVDHIESNPNDSDNPVSDFIEKENFSIHEVKQRENIKRISALITELTAIVNTLIAIKTDKSKKAFFEIHCINSLLSTYYIDIGKTNLTALYNLRFKLKVLLNSNEISSEEIQETIKISEEIMSVLTTIKQDLSKGIYKEPEQVTSLVWEYSGSQVQYSHLQCLDIASRYIDKLDD